jgi:D-sedoheptulose 7-phosphate isomerase
MNNIKKSLDLINQRIRESISVKEKMLGDDGLMNKLAEISCKIIDAIRRGHKVIFFGNGGSAADAQHLATEFVIRLSPHIKRPGLPAIALTTDSSMLTAGANDIGYDNVFSRSVEALGNEGDLLIGISTSGNSESINSAFQKAREKKMATIGFLGKDGGKSKKLVDLSIIIPSNDTQRIQECHITIGHIIFQQVEQEMFGKQRIWTTGDYDFSAINFSNNRA